MYIKVRRWPATGLAKVIRSARIVMRPFMRSLLAPALGDAIQYAPPRSATVDELALFHSADYIDFVSKISSDGYGFLDGGDTPAFPGVFDIASDVVGTTLAAVDA